MVSGWLVPPVGGDRPIYGNILLLSNPGNMVQMIGNVTFMEELYSHVESWYVLTPHSLWGQIWGCLDIYFFYF